MSFKVKCTVFVVCGAVLVPAHGQIPVTITSDVPAAVHQVETLARWAEQLQSMRSQYERLSQQYQAITGHYGRGAMGLTESLSSASVVPGSWQEVVAQQKNGAFGTFQKDVENLIHTLPSEKFHDPASLSATDYKLSTDAVRAAMASGQALYTQIQTNLNNLAGMASQIDLTSNTKDAADLQNRIATENGLLQSALAKLNLMHMNVQASMLNSQNQAAAINQLRYNRTTP